MRRMFLSGAAAVALVSGAAAMIGPSAIAQAATAVSAMTAEQKAAYDAWPADKKAAYDAWPAEYKAYFWSLNTNRQTGSFSLSPEQCQQILGMNAAQRSAAWVSIEAQLAGQPAGGAASPAASDPTAAAPPMSDPAASAPVEQVQANPPGGGTPSATPPNPPTAAAPVPPSQPADPTYNAGPYKGALSAPPADAMNKTYPVCTRTLQDNCRNPGGK